MICRIWLQTGDHCEVPDLRNKQLHSICLGSWLVPPSRNQVVQNQRAVRQALSDILDSKAVTETNQLGHPWQATCGNDNRILHRELVRRSEAGHAASALDVGVLLLARWKRIQHHSQYRRIYIEVPYPSMGSLRYGISRGLVKSVISLFHLEQGRHYYPSLPKRKSSQIRTARKEYTMWAQTFKGRGQANLFQVRLAIIRSEIKAI